MVSTNQHSKVVTVDPGWCDRVIDPLVLRLVNIQLRAERPLVGDTLGALIRKRALCTGEWNRITVRLHEILADFRPDIFEEIPYVTDDRIVAANCTLGLHEVPQPDQRQATEHRSAHKPPQRKPGELKADQCQQSKYSPRPIPLRNDRFATIAHEASPSWNWCPITSLDESGRTASHASN